LIRAPSNLFHYALFFSFFNLFPNPIRNIIMPPITDAGSV
jgi:hypothetical protein